MAKKFISEIQFFSENRWSNREKEAVMRIFGQKIQKRKYAAKGECEKAVMEEELSGRSWTNVKDYMRNLIKKNIKSTQ